MRSVRSFGERWRMPIHTNANAYGCLKKARKFRRRIDRLINSTSSEALILPPTEYREFTSTENKYMEPANTTPDCLTLRKNQLRGNASVDWYQRWPPRGDVGT